MFVIFSVFYILIAAAMIVLILLQNGAGADAGSGFGGGASATVFGARGSATFLTRATGVLATLFFVISLGMGIYMHLNGAPQQKSGDLGIMAGGTPKAATPAVPLNSDVPAAAPAAASKPVSPAQAPAEGKQVPAAGEIPAASSTSKQH